MNRDDAEQELAGWWRSAADDEIRMVVAKAIEYGANDLIEMGRTLAYMANREGLTDAQLAELGCVQYLVGKMARVTAAWAEGRTPSDDTYLDIGVYVRMIQRIRQTGGWPGSREQQLSIPAAGLTPEAWAEVFEKSGYPIVINSEERT